MRTRVRWATLGALLLMPVVAWAQYPSEVVGFNGGTIDDPSAQEMFRIPEWSGSTVSFVIPNDTGQYNYNYAARFSGLQTEGAAAMQVMWYWADPNDPDGWVRLTTFAGVDYPNPSLNTEGKVRFEFTNKSQLFTGAVGICLSIRESGIVVPQLADGGTAGDIEWVGVDTSTLTLIKGGPDGIIQSTLGGDDVIIDTNADPNIVAELISWGANRTFESTWNSGSDDVRIYGVYASDTGGVAPIPQIIVNPAPGAFSLEWDLTTGVVSIDGVPQGGGIASFTGDGDLNAPNNRGTLDAVCFTNYVANAADQIIVAIDEFQVESPVADPVLAPTVVWPIIVDDEHVYVTDIQNGATRVDLLLNGAPYLFQNISTMDDVDFTLPAPAVTGDIYSATQTVGGIASAESPGVEVLPGPPPFTFSLLIDQGGTGSCDYSTGGWEWVGASAVSNWDPTGQPLFADDGVWQTVDVPLTDDDLVFASLGGNGALEESPSGFYTIDSIWMTLADPAAVDPNAPIYWEMFVDSVQVIDEFGQPGEVVLTLDDGAAHFDGNRGQSPDLHTSSAPSTTSAYDGLTSHRIYWAYNGTAPESVGVLQRISGCATSAEIPDTATAIRFRLLVRAQRTAPSIALPVIVGPIVGNQTTVRVQNDATATSIQLYINGVAAGAPVTPTGTPTDFAGLTLAAGDSISATQDLPTRAVSDLAYPKVMQAKPLPPSIVTPVAPGTNTVTVATLWTAPFATASLVTVFVNDVQQGTVVPSGSSAVVTLAVTLQTGDTVTATQTVNTTTSDKSLPVTVAFTAPVLYKAPAAGDATVTVQQINALADKVTIVVNDVTEYPTTITPGVTTYDAPVSGGLTAGQTVKAYYSVGVVNSVASAADTVTDNTITVRFTDSMEAYADQADFENASGEVRNIGWWPASGDPGLNLVTDRNATIGGSKSAYAPAGMSPPAAGWADGWQSNFDFAYPEPDFPDMAGTNQSPLVWSVNIYDAGGAGTNNLYQWAELRDYTTGSLGAIIAVGMPGTSFFPTIDNNYYAARIYVNPGYVNLNGPGAPTRTVGWHTFTTVIKATTIDFYVDGILARKNVSRATKLFDNLYMSSGYAPGLEGWYDDYYLHNGKVTFQPRLPNAPKVESPLVEGDTVVAVSSIEPTATLVTVYADGSPIGSINPNGAASIDVPVTALVHLDAITAGQTTTVGTSGVSAALEVGKGNGDILICIGIRETADTGSLGTQGSNTGTIEWLGATAKVDNAPQGKPLSPSASWQTITFDPAVDTVTAWTGDGILSSANGRGVLEHLAVAVDSASADRSTGPYELYVDNVINVGAGDGGVDVVITDFEGYPLDAEALFQEPTYSGSTSAHLSYPPSASVTTDDEGNPGQSEFLTWFWKDTTAQRWARITTDGVATKPRPIIDLTKAIRMDVLLVTAGPAVCHGDANCDGQINFADINAFVDAIVKDIYCDGTGANADVNGGGSVGFEDINPFVDLLTQNPLPIICP